MKAICIKPFGSSPKYRASMLAIYEFDRPDHDGDIWNNKTGYVQTRQCFPDGKPREVFPFFDHHFVKVPKR